MSLGSEKRRGAATLPEAAWETSPPPCLLVEEVPGLWVTRDSNGGWSPVQQRLVGGPLQDWVWVWARAPGCEMLRRSTRFLSVC